MKFWNISRLKQTSAPKKTLSIMRLTTLFSIIFSLQISASVYSQQTKMSLDADNLSIKEVLFLIEKQSGFRFIYESEKINLNRKVTVHLKEKTVEAILKHLFDKEGVSYEITDSNFILINPATKGEKASFSSVSQQREQITGIVTDVNGEPIIGANVVEKGVTNGTTTDMNGKFSLLVSRRAMLEISYIGYLAKTVVVGESTVLDIKLIENTQALDEVVVVGYGTQKKRDVTGSVASVSSKDLRSLPVTNSTSLLQGRAAGVMVSADNGSPGAAVSVRIRGIGTVNNNSPLYVIDGVPVEGMSNINPLDIERMEILKDASASAIYGARAANGVVLVTTKKGQLGKPNITFETYMGSSSPWKSLRQLNAGQYYDMVKVAHQNGGTSVPTDLEKSYKQGYDTDWWKEITRSAMVQNYYLSASGGSEEVKYAFSGGYFQQDGIVKGSDYERFSFRMNSDYKLSRYVKVGINLGITNVNKHVIPTSGQATNAVHQSRILEPLIPVRSPDMDTKDPNYEFNQYTSPTITDATNPVAVIARNFDKRNEFVVTGNVYADVNLYKGLVYKMNLGLDINNDNKDVFAPQYYLNPREFSNLNSVERAYGRGNRLAFENTLAYDVTIADDHVLSVLGGITAETLSSDGFSGSKQGTPSNGEYFRVLGAATENDQITGFKNHSALLSYLGRINYNYKNKYLLTASVRRDGSSRFAKGNQWGTFPSASFGWRISEEAFFKKLEASFIDDLKIRIGWGQIGNQNIADNAYLSLIDGSNFRRYSFGGIVLQGYSPSTIGNPDIKWETVEQTNFAVDMSLFNNKLTLSADYYIKRTKDMLLNLPIVSYSGFPNNPWSNAGTVDNRGLELQLTYRNMISDFNYEIGLNFSTIKNEVVSLGKGEPLSSGGTKMGNVTKTEVGHSIGEFYGYAMDGIFQTEDEVKAGYQPNARPGDVRFKDIAGPKDANGNLTGPDGKIDDNDKSYIGSPIPDCMLGLNLALSYKNFDLSMFFQGVFGNEIYNAHKIFTHAPAGYYNVSEDAYLNAWKGAGTSNEQPIISTNNPNDNFRNSSFFVENGSYLRLKNAQLGYRLPKAWTDLMRISSVRLYVSAQNLFTITGYKGIDPELSLSSPLGAGIDAEGVYPQSKTFMGGISVNF